MASINHRGIRKMQGKGMAERISFVDQKGFFVMPAQKPSYSRAERLGEAYAFFYCSAPKENVRKELPGVVNASKTPNTLEISVKEGIDPHDFDLEGGKPSELGWIADDALKQGLNYLMKVTDYDSRKPGDRGKDNKLSALKIKDILGNLYASSLYKKGEKFRGKIFYERVPGAYPGDYAEI